MKCVHPGCDAKASLHPVVTYATTDPSLNGEIHLVMPLCPEHGQHDPANVITDGAFASLCEMVKEQRGHVPVRESVDVRFEPLHELTDDAQLAALLRAEP